MDHTDIPSKLKNTNNQLFLNNAYDPINKKYVKKIWAYKLTKLKREKRDLIWEYFKYRGRWSTTFRMKGSYQKNVREVGITYFGDPKSYRFTLTKQHMDIMKDYEKLINHTLSLKLVTKTLNEKGNGYQWDMMTMEQFNKLPILNKVKPVILKDYGDVNPNMVVEINNDDVELSNSCDDDLSDEVSTHGDNNGDNNGDNDDDNNGDNNGDNDGNNDGNNGNNDDVEFSNSCDDAERLPENDEDLAESSSDSLDESLNDGCVITNKSCNMDHSLESTHYTVCEMVSSLMNQINDEYVLKNHKLVNINGHVWLNILMKANDKHVIFLKKLRAMKEKLKTTLDNGVTLTDGSVIHLYWTQKIRTPKKKKRIENVIANLHNNKKNKKERRKVKRQMRTKKGHIHIPI
jgi:hypothetical protein